MDLCSIAKDNFSLLSVLLVRKWRKQFILKVVLKAALILNMFYCRRNSLSIDPRTSYFNIGNFMLVLHKIPNHRKGCKSIKLFLLKWLWSWSSWVFPEEEWKHSKYPGNNWEILKPTFQVFLCTTCLCPFTVFLFSGCLTQHSVGLHLWSLWQKH